MKRMAYSLVVFFLATTFSLASNAQTSCPSSCSLDLTDCYEPASGSGMCPSASCSGNFKIPNTVLTISAKSVNLGRIDMCYVPGPTPPWTSTLVIGRLMNTALRPSATRVFNSTAHNGATFECTVESNGLWSVRLISGTAPGKGMTLTGGSYAL